MLFRSVDKFDCRWQLVAEKQPRNGTLTQEDVADTSLYEFWWKFRQVRGKLVRENPRNQRVLVVTPGFSSDSACVLSDGHNDYARAAVIAHWRMMPTDVRLATLRECAIFDEPRANLSDPVRTILWGTTSFKKPQGRHLGVQDLVDQFETDAVDAKGRKLGWAMALLEMLVDPMLMSWVPGWVHEQYERWNPCFRGALRWALKQRDGAGERRARGASGRRRRPPPSYGVPSAAPVLRPSRDGTKVRAVILVL